MNIKRMLIDGKLIYNNSIAGGADICMMVNMIMGMEDKTKMSFRLFFGHNVVLMMQSVM